MTVGKPLKFSLIVDVAGLSSSIRLEVVQEQTQLVEIKQHKRKTNKKDKKRFAAQLALGVKKHLKVYDHWKALEIVFNLRRSRNLQLNSSRSYAGTNIVCQNRVAKKENDYKMYKCFAIQLGSGILKHQKVCDRWKALEIIFNLRRSWSLQLNSSRCYVETNIAYPNSTCLWFQKL